MAQEALKDLAKQIFWLIAITLILGMPMMVFVGPRLEKVSLESGGMTGEGWFALAGLSGFTLIVVGVVVFWIFPALIKFGEAILKARRDANRDMFP